MACWAADISHWHAQRDEGAALYLHSFSVFRCADARCDGAFRGCQMKLAQLNNTFILWMCLTGTMNSTKPVTPYTSAPLSPHRLFLALHLFCFHGNEEFSEHSWGLGCFPECLAPELELAFPQPSGFVKWSFPLGWLQASLGLSLTAVPVFPSHRPVPPLQDIWKMLWLVPKSGLIWNVEAKYTRTESFHLNVWDFIILVGFDMDGNDRVNRLILHCM